MKQLNKDIQSVAKTLKKLSQKTDKMTKRLQKLEKAKVSARKASKRLPRDIAIRIYLADPRKSGLVAPAAKVFMHELGYLPVPRTEKLLKINARKRPTQAEAVQAIIKRSRKGMDVTTLRKRTGLEGRKITDIVHRLKKQGKIKTSARGVYVKA